MPNYIVRPTSVISQTGGTTPSVPSTVLTNLGDNSDTTTVVATAPTTNVTYAWQFGLGTPTIPTDEYPARIESYCRWTGGSGGYLFASAFRTGTAAYNNSYYYDGRVAQTTTRTELQALYYSRTDITTAGNLRLNLGFMRFTNGVAPTIADTWATIYTVKQATASISPVTMTTSTYPIIPVTATATIDWEASASDASNLRKVITHVRIESGGTGVGTGTLRYQSGTNFSMSFTATGSNTINVISDVALPNGTYNVYARAIRFRDNQSFADAYASAEQASAWVASTLTMNNPLPTAPTLNASADQFYDRVGLFVTPIATAGHTLPTIDVERSDDAGVTYKPVRGATGYAGTFGSQTTFYDYECPRANNLVQYRARVNTTYTGGITMTSDWTTTAATTITAVDWNLKCPENSALNILDINVIDKPTEQLTEDIGVFRPMDRRYPITVSGALGGWDGDLTIMTNSAAEWASVKSLLEAQKVLLLESNFGWSKYIRIVGGAKVELMGSSTAPRRRIQVSYVETTAP